MSAIESFLELFTRLTTSWRKPGAWAMVTSHTGVDHALDYTLDQASKIAEAFKRPSGRQDTDGVDPEEQTFADALPKGLVLYGHGCGSGGLTRAIAKELNAHFFVGTVSDGVAVAGPLSIAHYFSQASELAELAAGGRPVLLFLKGANELVNSAPHPVSAALACNEAIARQMDELAQTSGVLVVIEAERLGQVDSELFEDGRFEVQIEVEKPDYKGRLAIFQRHLASYSDLPKATPGKGSRHRDRQQSVQILVLLDGTWEEDRLAELTEICQECSVLSNGLHADQIYSALYLLRTQATITGGVTAEQLFNAIELQQGKP